MATNYDRVDFTFSYNGDFQIGRDGDIADTQADQIQSLAQEVQSISASALNDWNEHPSYGAGLDDFIGEPNTSRTAESIRMRLNDALVINNIVRQDDLTVIVFPVGLNSVMCIVRIKAAATPNNSLDSNTITISLVFDYQERGIWFVEG